MLMVNLTTVSTQDLIKELIDRGDTDTDNEGQYLIYTGVYEK
jgi:predicted transcriptional regulator